MPQFEIAERDESRQTCKACGQADYFNFDVPDEVWVAVVPEHLRNRVVCLGCFDRFALTRGVQYGHHVREVFFAGDVAAFRLVAEPYF